jgi:hypothetical protein
MSVFCLKSDVPSRITYIITAINFQNLHKGAKIKGKLPNTKKEIKKEISRKKRQSSVNCKKTL